MPYEERQYSKKIDVFTRVGQGFALYRFVEWLEAKGTPP